MCSNLCEEGSKLLKKLHLSSLSDVIPELQIEEYFIL